MTADMLRLIRCSLLYDTVATRLDPKIDVRLMHRYFADAQKRRARRGVGPLRVPLVKRAGEVSQGGGERLVGAMRALDQLDMMLPPVTVRRTTRPSFAVTLSNAARNAVIAGGPIAALAILGDQFALPGVTYGCFLIAMFVFATLLVRRVRSRLHDTHA